MLVEVGQIGVSGQRSRWQNVGRRYLSAMTTGSGDDTETRIRSIHIEAGEGEHHVDFERDEDGWIRVEQLEDDEGFVTSDEVARTSIGSLATEIEGHAQSFQIVTEVVVEGVTGEELVAWIGPLLNANQDSITVNGRSYELCSD